MIHLLHFYDFRYSVLLDFFVELFPFEGEDDSEYPVENKGEAYVYKDE